MQTQHGMPPRSIGSATISVGLVAIPVKLYATGEPSHEVHFHMVHAGCGQRVHQELVCPKHGVVPRDRITKGYEPRKGHIIELEASELKALDAVATGAIEIREFVPAFSVDLMFIEHSYYLGPDKAGARPYRLLRDALEQAALVAIGAYAARGKSYIVMVRPFETGLAMHQLRYADEVKPWSSIEVEAGGKPAKAELDLAMALIDRLRHEEFDPSRYHDEVKQRVLAMLAEKVKHGEVIEAEKPVAPARVTDLLAALKASLAAPSRTAGSKSTTRSVEPRPGHAASRKATRARPHRASSAAARRPAASARTGRS